MKESCTADPNASTLLRAAAATLDIYSLSDRDRTRKLEQFENYCRGTVPVWKLGSSNSVVNYGKKHYLSFCGYYSNKSDDTHITAANASDVLVEK